MAKQIIIYPDKCMQCGLCEGACFYGAITMKEYPEVATDNCTLCGNCVSTCPQEAIECAGSDPEFKQAEAVESDGIWVFVELEQDQIADVTFELLGAARRLAVEKPQPVVAILMGKACAHHSRNLFEAGADSVYLTEDEELRYQSENNFAEVLEALVKIYSPEILLIGATHFGRGLSARLAGVLRTGLTADCTELSIDLSTGHLMQSRPAFGGNLMATIETPNHRPQMASVRPQVMKRLEGDYDSKQELVYCQVKPVKVGLSIKLLAEKCQRLTAESIIDAPILVAGGRGMQNEKNILLLHQLAEALGGTVAASRAAVEAGWLPYDCQVGQTGKTVAPKLYIACGISGQIQHTAALSGAETIIAINSDADAPIFNYADYGLVGDVAEVLPALIKTLRT